MARGSWLSRRLFLGHEPWAMSVEPWAISHETLIIKNRLIYGPIVFIFLWSPPLRVRGCLWHVSKKSCRGLLKSSTPQIQTHGKWKDTYQKKWRGSSKCSACANNLNVCGNMIWIPVFSKNRMFNLNNVQNAFVILLLLRNVYCQRVFWPSWYFDRYSNLILPIVVRNLKNTCAASALGLDQCC